MNPISGLYVLDTRLVVHVVRGSQIGEVADKRFALRTRPERPLISVTTIAEVRRAAATLAKRWTPEQVSQLDALLAEFSPVNIHSRLVQDAYVQIGSTLDNALETIPDRKVWVAAVAAATNAALLTYDTDYQRIPGNMLNVVFVPRAELEQPEDDGDPLELPLES